MKPLLLFLVLSSFSSMAQTDLNTRAMIAKQLQEGAYDGILSTTASAQPKDTFLLQAGGYAAYQSGDRALAESYYERVLALDSNDRQALYYTAVIHKGDEDHTAARPLLERLCTIVPAVANYHVLLADCYSAMAKPKEALTQLRLANALSPASAVIAARLANAYIRLKSWDSAERILTPAIAAHPADIPLLSAGITLAYNQKKWARTAALADSMIATHKLRYEPMLTALYSDIEGVNWKHAVAIGETLMALGSETEEVLYSTAFAHQRMRHWKEADTLMRRCVRKVMRPSLEHYYLMLAELAASQGETSRAGAYYDTSYYLFRNPFTLYQKGVLMSNTGRIEEARVTFQKYLTQPAAKQDTSIARYMRQMLER